MTESEFTTVFLSIVCLGMILLLVFSSGCAGLPSQINTDFGELNNATCTHAGYGLFCPVSPTPTSVNATPSQSAFP
jgi:hypothetical protein